MTVEYPTSLGTSTADEIRLLGQDLTADLMGEVGFGELAFWLVAMRRPSPSETRLFEAVLVALADLGLPVEMLRGFALLARAAGLLGQLAEERRRPIGMDAYLAVDRNAVYVDPAGPAE